MRITVQVLNGSTGEIREVVTDVKASGEQEAISLLFARARRDDYYYRFLGHSGVLVPAGGESVKYQAQEFWARQ